MLIQWSDEDDVYIVSVPEFPGHHTHGATYEEAARHPQEAIELLLEAAEAEGEPVPAPHVFAEV